MEYVYQIAKSQAGVWHVNVAPYWNGKDPGRKPTWLSKARHQAWLESQGDWVHEEKQRFINLARESGVSLACQNYGEIVDFAEFCFDELIRIASEGMWEGNRICKICEKMILDPGGPWLFGRKIRAITKEDAESNRRKAS
jgi:hypothetical protein